MRIEVDFDIPETERFGRFDPGATQHGLHSREELSHAERLGDVVVTTEIKSQDLVSLLHLRREEDHRRFDVALSQGFTDLVTIHLRKHDIENEQVRSVIERPLETLFALAGDRYLVALKLQILLQAEGDRVIVLDDEDLRFRCGFARLPTHEVRLSNSIYSASTCVLRRNRVKLLPPPNWLVTLISPLWTLAMYRANASPSPVPSTSLVR